MAGDAWAQGTGTVAGQVTAASTGRPVANAQVFIADLNQGSLTQANGRFLLLSVPTGTHTLSVSSIGFGSVRPRDHG